MISLEEAREYVMNGVAPLTATMVSLENSLGCVLGSDVHSGEAIPPFANSAMDGFAVRAADTLGAAQQRPASLKMIGTIAAGAESAIGLAPGEAFRIMTGAPMPLGADAVVMVERTAASIDGRTVGVLTEVKAGNHVRPAGDDLVAGQLVFSAGEVVSAGHIGVLASIGAHEVFVVPRVRVGVFSTGDELVDVSTPAPLPAGRIRDSNRITLLSLLRQSGVDVVDLGRVVDDEGDIAKAIEDGAKDCDALITTGGVSMGDFDFVKVVLDRIGDMRWMQIRIKPAKPLAFGTVSGPGGRRVPVFGLPGNPVSSLVSFELFARPALRHMMGRAESDLDRPHVIALADEPLRRHADGRTHFARVVVSYDASDASYHVRSAGAQGSHQLTAMAAANGLGILPDGGPIKVGAQVTTILLD